MAVDLELLQRDTSIAARGEQKHVPIVVTHDGEGQMGYVFSWGGGRQRRERSERMSLTRIERERFAVARLRASGADDGKQTNLEFEGPGGFKVSLEDGCDEGNLHALSAFPKSTRAQTSTGSQVGIGSFPLGLASEHQASHSVYTVRGAAQQSHSILCMGEDAPRTFRNELGRLVEVSLRGHVPNQAARGA